MDDYYAHTQNIVNMRNIYRMIVLTWMVVMAGLAGSYAHAADTTSPDSIYTWDYIQSICINEPHRALKLLDEMQARKPIPQFSLDQMRAIVYNNGLQMYQLALTYTLRAYHNDSIRQHPEDVMLVFEMLSDIYNTVGNYTESTRFAVEGIDYARQIGDKRSEASLLFCIGLNKRDMGLKEDGDEYMVKAMRIQEQLAEGSQDWGLVDDVIFTYEMLSRFALEDEKYQEAIDLLPRYENMLDRLKTCPDIPDGAHDLRLSGAYSTYACIFQLNGQPDKGAEYYRKCMETESGKTNDGKLYSFRYLMAAGRHHELLKALLENKRMWGIDGDTINYIYLENDAHYEAQVYSALGDYKSAANAYRRMYVILDSLRIREKQNGVVEFATIYETKEKEAKLAEQAARLHENQIILLLATCIIGLLGFLLWRNIRHSRIVKSKNQAMAGTIDDLLGYRDELFRRKEENLTLKEQLQAAEEELQRRNEIAAMNLPPAEIVLPASAEDISSTELPEAESSADNQEEVPVANSASVFNDRALFDRVEHEIIGRKLYLQPDFSRDELMKIVRIPKNKFAPLFKQYAGSGFSGYINNLRLEYAAKLLKEQPDYTIDSIAESCGISSTTTFYRLFVGRFGMTPTEYRRSNK